MPNNQAAVTDTSPNLFSSPDPELAPSTLRVVKCPTCSRLHLMLATEFTAVVTCACSTKFCGAEAVVQDPTGGPATSYATWQCPECDKVLLVPSLATHLPASCPCGCPYSSYLESIFDWTLDPVEDALIGNDPLFLERAVSIYRAAQRYTYGLQKLTDRQYLLTNTKTLEQHRVTLGAICDDDCECEVFVQGGRTCIHIEHLRLRLGLPSPALKFRDEMRGIYAWFDTASLPPRIRLGCVGDTHAVARQAVHGILAIEDAATLQEVERRVKRHGVSFSVLPSVQLALRAPDGIVTDTNLNRLVTHEGREWLATKLPQLKHYQIEGALFLAYAQRALLLDEMGLGKTLQAIAAALLLKSMTELKSCLVIAPKSVMEHWAEELRRHANLPCTIVSGNPDARQRLYHSSTLFKVVTLESLRRDFPNIGNHDLIIVDEVQKLRDVTALSHRVVSRIESRFFFGLSGTAIEKGLSDLYGVLRAARVPDLETPLEFFASHVVCDEYGAVIATLAPEAFFIRHADRILRRLKSEVEPTLPDLRISTVDLALSPLQQQLASRMIAELDEVTERLAARYEMNDFIRARWLINRLVELSDSSALIAAGTNQSSKLDWLRTYLLETCARRKEKVVLFTRWIRSLHLVCELCRQIGVGFETLCGDNTAAERDAAIKRFQQNRDLLVFISTDAGGVGVNLQFAHRVILLEPSWNPSVDAQRIQRLHRIGQTRSVEAVCLYTELDWKFVLATHGKKAFPARVIDAVRSPISYQVRPTWFELLAVINYYRCSAQRDSASAFARLSEILQAPVAATGITDVPSSLESPTDMAANARTPSSSNAPARSSSAATGKGCTTSEERTSFDHVLVDGKCTSPDRTNPGGDTRDAAANQHPAATEHRADAAQHHRSSVNSNGEQPTTLLPSSRHDFQVGDHINYESLGSGRIMRFSGTRENPTVEIILMNGIRIEAPLNSQVIRKAPPPRVTSGLTGRRSTSSSSAGRTTKQYATKPNTNSTRQTKHTAQKSTQASSAQEKHPTEPARFEVGEIVWDRVFGLGRIETVVGEGAQMRGSVAFEQHGPKTFGKWEGRLQKPPAPHQ